MLRRDFLSLVGSLSAKADSERLNLCGFRKTFEFDFKSRRPIFHRDGGPFTTRFEQWGKIRTLVGTGEEQLYVDRDYIPNPGGTDKMGHNDGPATASRLGYDPFSLSPEGLSITAVRVNETQRRRVDRPYLSGMICTEWTFKQRFGYFEISANLPEGKGLWPAFWLVSDGTSDEIDVFEAIGEQNRVRYAIHKPGQPALFGAVARTRPSFDYSAGLHAYGVLWTDKELIFYVDRTESARADATMLAHSPPMYLIVDLAIGGWAKSPPPETRFPASLMINYIRVYCQSM
jgi:beta-glucanase (GH16 family)